MVKTVDPVLKELVAIKRLLIMTLLRSALTQGQVASALEVDQSQISRMFPKGSTGRAKRKPLEGTLQASPSEDADLLQ